MNRSSFHTQSTIVNEDLLEEAATYRITLTRISSSSTRFSSSVSDIYYCFKLLSSLFDFFSCFNHSVHDDHSTSANSRGGGHFLAGRNYFCTRVICCLGSVEPIRQGGKYRMTVHKLTQSVFPAGHCMYVHTLTSSTDEQLVHTTANFIVH